MFLGHKHELTFNSLWREGWRGTKREREREIPFIYWNIQNEYKSIKDLKFCTNEYMLSIYSRYIWNVQSILEKDKYPCLCNLCIQHFWNNKIILSTHFHANIGQFQKKNCLPWNEIVTKRSLQLIHQRALWVNERLSRLMITAHPSSLFACR